MSMNPNREKELIDLYKFSDIELLRYFKNNPLSIAFFPLSKRLYIKKKYLEVIKICKKGVELFDDFNDARILLAKAYTKTEQYSEAVQELKKIIKIDPNYADAYYYISEILFAQKAIEKAKVLLTKAYELSPESGHIKNSFNKYFKSSTETVANYIVEQTIVTSIEDLKKYDSKLDIDKTLPKININEEKTIALDIYQNKQAIDDLRVEKKETAKNISEDLSFLDDLEKEFGYGKYKKYFLITGGFLVIFILFSVLFSIIQSQKQQILNTKRKEIIKELNNDLKKIDIFKNSKLRDVINYYKLSYHYEIDSNKYLETKKYIQSLKPKSFYQYLAKMVYYLYELEFDLFNEIYEKLKIENSENPDIFMLKGYQLILSNDFLNASNQFILAYEKSQKELKYKLALSYLYQKQNNFNNSFELLKDNAIYNIECDILKTLAENNANTDKIVLGLISFTKEDNLKIKLYIYLLNYYQKKSDFDKINDVLKIIGESINNKYYKKVLDNFKIK